MELHDYVRVCSDTLRSEYVDFFLNTLIKSCKLYDGLVLPPKDTLCHVCTPSALTTVDVVHAIIDRLYVENLNNADLKIVVIDTQRAMSMTGTAGAVSTIKGRRKITTINTANPKQTYANVIIVIDDTSKPYVKTATIRKLKSCDSSVVLVSGYANNASADRNSKACQAMLGEVGKTELLQIGVTNDSSTISTVKERNLNIEYRTYPLGKMQLSDVDANSADTVAQILSDVLEDNDCRKVLCLVSERKVVTKFKNLLSKRLEKTLRSKKITDPTVMPYLLGVKILDRYEFYDHLNDCVTSTLLGDGKIERSDSTGLFITTLDDLDTSCMIGLKHIDCVMMLGSADLTDPKIVRLFDQIMTYSDRTTHVQPLTIIDTDRADRIRQIVNAYDLFYDTERATYSKDCQDVRSADRDTMNAELAELKKAYDLECYAKIDELVRSDMIQVQSEFTTKEVAALEKTYGIRKKDYAYIDRHKMMYVNTVSKSRIAMSTGHMLDLEQRYLYLPNKVGEITGFRKNRAYCNKVRARTEELTSEVEQILAGKLKSYSGPMWLGKDGGSEAQGSMLAYADDDNDTIEVCQILGTHKFTRTYKRQGWTEKENRDKKILFLSPVLMQISLSEFRKTLKRPSYRKFSRMEKIEYEFKL